MIILEKQMTSSLQVYLKAKSLSALSFLLDVSVRGAADVPRGHLWTRSSSQE